MLGRIETRGKARVDGHVDVLVVAVEVLDLLLGQRGVLVEDQVGHERVAVGEQVEVSAPVGQGNVILRLTPQRANVIV